MPGFAYPPSGMIDTRDVAGGHGRYRGEHRARARRGDRARTGRPRARAGLCGDALRAARRDRHRMAQPACRPRRCASASSPTSAARMLPELADIVIVRAAAEIGNHRMLPYAADRCCGCSCPLDPVSANSAECARPQGSLAQWRSPSIRSTSSPTAASAAIRLAVVHDADGLDSEQMQAIARELNLSETVFVLKPENPAHSAKVRIFTPGRELPSPAIRRSAPQSCSPSCARPSSTASATPSSCWSRRSERCALACALRAGHAPFAEFDAPKLPEKIGHARRRATAWRTRSDCCRAKSGSRTTPRCAFPPATRSPTSP